MEVDAEDWAAFQAFQRQEAARKRERIAAQWVRYAREAGGDPMSITRAYKMATVLMAAHGVSDWELRVGNGLREAGSAKSRVNRDDGLFNQPGTITLSGPLMSLWTEEQQRETILHEIAHALTGPRHDSRWARACHTLGIPAVRLWGENGEAHAPLPWVGTCPGGHAHRPRARRPTTEYSCNLCCPGRFDENALITWAKQ